MYNAAIFRAYDIRGITERDFDPEFFRLLGEYLIIQTKSREVIVGCDARPDSDRYSALLSKGVVEAGARAVTIGRVPIEVLYASVGLREGSSGAYLGASHNPAGWSGVKLMGPGVVPITGEEVLQWFSSGSPAVPYPSTGLRASQMAHQNPWPGYILKVREVVGRLTLPRLKVVVDAGNGLGGLFFEHLPSLRQRLELIPLFLEPDGRFPSHEPNPLKSKNREAAKDRLFETKADLAVLFDGDADRVIFLDDLGHFVPPDFIGTLIAEELIASSVPAGDTSGVKGSHTPEVKEAGQRVVIDPRRGFAVKDAASRLGGQVVVAQAGYPNIKAAMREHQAIFGVETSGHMYYREFFSSESSLITFLLVLKMLARTKQKLSQLVHPLFQQYFFIEEENVPLPKQGSLEWVYRRLRTAFPGGKISELDGLSIDCPDWHLNLRPSNTEPLLRLNLEARSRTKLDEIHSRLKRLLD